MRDLEGCDNASLDLLSSLDCSLADVAVFPTRLIEVSGKFIVLAGL